MTKDLVEVSLEWGARAVRNAVSTLQLERGRVLFVGEAEACGLSVPGLERHALVTWDAAQPIVAVPPAARMRVGRAIRGEGTYRLRAGEEIEIHVRELVLRVAWISRGLAAGMRGRGASIDARPIAWSVVGHAVALAVLGIVVGRGTSGDLAAKPKARTDWRVNVEREVAEARATAAANATATTTATTTATPTPTPTTSTTATPAATATTTATATAPAISVAVREVETFGMISLIRAPRRVDAWPVPRAASWAPSIDDALPLAPSVPDDRWSDDQEPWANQ